MFIGRMTITSSPSIVVTTGRFTTPRQDGDFRRVDDRHG
jgi:hypothetical protein